MGHFQEKLYWEISEEMAVAQQLPFEKLPKILGCLL
jgi:hypothetical protein